MPRKKSKPHVIPTKLEVLLEQYVQARIADHEKGGGDPADYAEIELYLLEARTDLREYLQVVVKHAIEEVSEYSASGPDAARMRTLLEDLERFPQTTL